MDTYIELTLTRIQVRLFTDKPIPEAELARLASALRRKADQLIITHTSVESAAPAALDVLEPRRFIVDAT